MYAVQLEREKINDWVDCWLGDDKKTGYVTVTDFNFKKSYGAKDINTLKRDTMGVEKRFITLNGFTFGERQTGELKQIRNIGIDIDQYEQGLSIEDGLDVIQAMIIERIIPEPNLVLTSRGIQLFYTIQGGASPSMSWLSSFITDQYVGKLRHIGADGNAKDVARVMRVPNSINERNGAIVKPEIWNPYKYTLQELQSYCKPLDRFNYKGKKRADVKRITPKNLSFFYKTNNARLVDLERLIELRSGDFTEKRNIFLYIYAYHQALLCSSLADTQAFIYDVNDRIFSRSDKPISKNELNRTVKSAYEDSREFFEHYKANGFKVVNRLNDGVVKPYKTTNLIEILEITTDEQRELKRIHTGVVSREKDTERKRKERREQGMKPMQEYNAERQTQKENKLQQLKQMLESDSSLSNRKIADLMGVSEGYIRKLKRQI